VGVGGRRNININIHGQPFARVCFRFEPKLGPSWASNFDALMATLDADAGCSAGLSTDYRPDAIDAP
jgi:hypothetical protein